MTAARPKIANYPFSTLTPNLGVVKRPDRDGYVMADIPGLVEGASLGVGLGHKFLRHVERTRLLIHLADISSPSFEEDIETVQRELVLYSERLSKLPQIVVLNKADLLPEDDSNQAIARLKQRARLATNGMPGFDPLIISCATRTGVDHLAAGIIDCLSQLPQQPVSYEIAEDPAARAHAQDGFVIERHKKSFLVVSDRVNRLVEVTNQRDPESLYHLHQKLRSLGVIAALVESGAKQGSEVIMGGVSFSFGDEW